ncbi:alpha/beta fold hydrolase [Spirillospora sp. NPDC048911]|uniref:alpha/beta fold hydrolase n=1 Tax=Spirillospora sp. NPDC048911 TaxID=3364527 RepID=UPI003717FC55
MPENSLRVPGATLHYEVQGSGPVLVLIPAAFMGASAFGGVVPRLARDYTVVRYDPRGLALSTVDGPGEMPPEVLADDVRHLIAAVSDGPAHVFGTSNGAINGLSLAARHPEAVRTLVAHEPPVVELLPEREEYRAESERVKAVYEEKGPIAAMRAFMVGAGFAEDAGGEPEPWMLMMEKDIDVFYGRIYPALRGFVPDFAALRAGSAKVVIAGGIESKGEIAHRAAAAAATELGTAIVDFPGDHGSFTAHPEAFARALREVLD